MLLSCTTAAPPNRWAARPRDQLLAWIGFTELEYAPPAATRITAAGVQAVPAVVFSQAAELHGRPVAYLVTTVGEEEQPPARRGVDAGRPGGPGPHLQYPAGAGGVAYPTVHASTPVAHRGYLRDLAAETRKTDAGVWADDTTAEFALEDQASIGPKGQLILPRLFRRATDYLERSPAATGATWRTGWWRCRPARRGTRTTG